MELESLFYNLSELKHESVAGKAKDRFTLIP